MADTDPAARHTAADTDHAAQRVDYWRRVQAAQRPSSWLGSRVMLRQAREPDLQPYVQDITGGPA